MAPSWRLFYGLAQEGCRLVTEVSALEDSFAFQLSIASVKIPAFKREYKFDPERKWRIDFAWIELKIALEIQGGTHIHGARSHAGKSGYQADCDKANALALAGWRLFRFTSYDIRSVAALNMMERVFGDAQQIDL